MGSAISIISVIVALISVQVQLTDGEKLPFDTQVTPDYLESNMTRSTRDSDIELVLSRPADYHTFSELPILTSPSKIA
jgi:hypothetical protein